MATIIAIVQADGEGGYVASTPDFPQCSASSHTIDDVIKKLREALLLRLAELLEAGERIPSPTPMEAIQRRDASVLAAIEISDDIGTRRVQIAIPALSLARIESFANRRGLQLGALLVQAVDRWAMQEAGWRERRGAIPDGPTLFDFSSPPELRVEAVAAEFGPAPQASEDDGEFAGEGREGGIKAELARLLETAQSDIATDRQAGAGASQPEGS